MPELLRLFGLRFFFYGNDHEPSHVHVRNADGEARFTLNHVQCIENNGLKPKDVSLSMAIIEENKEIFQARWNEFFKK